MPPQFINPTQFLSPFFQPASQAPLAALPTLLSNKRAREGLIEKRRQFDVQQPLRRAKTKKAEAETRKLEKAEDFFLGLSGGVTNLTPEQKVQYQAITGKAFPETRAAKLEFAEEKADITRAPKERIAYGPNNETQLIQYKAGEEPVLPKGFKWAKGEKPLKHEWWDTQDKKHTDYYTPNEWRVAQRTILASGGSLEPDEAKRAKERLEIVGPVKAKQALDIAEKKIPISTKQAIEREKALGPIRTQETITRQTLLNALDPNKQIAQIKLNALIRFMAGQATEQDNAILKQDTFLSDAIRLVNELPFNIARKMTIDDKIQMAIKHAETLKAANQQLLKGPGVKETIEKAQGQREGTNLGEQIPQRLPGETIENYLQRTGQ